MAARTRRRPKKAARNPSTSSGWSLAGTALAGVGLVWIGRRLFSPSAPAPPPPAPRPQLPTPAPPPAMHGGPTVDRNGLLTVPLPEESAARSRAVRLPPPPPEPVVPRRSAPTQPGAEAADDSADHDSGGEGGNRLGDERF